MLVIIVITYCESELSSHRVHSRRKSAQLVSAYPVTDFIVIGCMQCRETWHLPLKEQSHTEHRAPKDSRRAGGQCCGNVLDTNCSDPLQEGI